MPGERQGVASWPGAISIDACQYTISHGITPGTAILRILPQTTPPAEVGDLLLYDKFDRILIPDCKVDNLQTERDIDGFVWLLQIVDRRWKWRDLGGISGEYNQLDDHGKLRPWTIRSPTELAILCLDKMGEKNYSIDLPVGLDSKIGALASTMNPPWVGVTPTTGTNPCTVWKAEPPAIALSKLAALYGRRVIYQLKKNRILIALPGVGADLPEGSFSKVAPSMKSPETPTGVTVAGAPTIVQARLLLVPVGLDWDGSYRPINSLSYAPVRGAIKQQNLVTITGAAVEIQGLTFVVTLNGVRFSYQPAPGEDALDVATALANRINGSVSPNVSGRVTATPFASGDDGQVEITARVAGQPFGVAVEVDAGENNPIIGIKVDIVRPNGPGTTDWSQAPPPDFPGIRATDRLTLVEARDLARRSVWRCYQLANFSAEIGDPNLTYLSDYPGGRGGIPIIVNVKPLTVPGYGLLVRRQQIILLDEQVEQITPRPGDDRLFDERGIPQTLSIYDGYSRAKPAAIFGAISVFCQKYFWNGTRPQFNTRQSEQVFVDFRINKLHQVCTFEKPVFFRSASGVVAPTLILQTGINILNAETNAPEVFTAQRLLPGMKGATNFAVRTYEDVQMSIIGQYDGNENITGATILEADPLARSVYYLDGMAAQYITSEGLTIDYNGLVSIDLDGAIAQVSWEIGRDGPKTTASRNTEHDVNVPPYPARRRAEFLRPTAERAAETQRVRNLGELPGQP